MNNLTVSFAGFGLVGQRRYAYINKLNNISVKSISDNYSPYRNKFKDGLIFKNYTEMFKKVKTDISFICLPNKHAVKATILALKNGSHVFCEKPPARNLHEMKKLKKIIKRYPHQILMYGFNHRYHDTIIKAKKIIDTKKFGNIINLRGVYGKSYITPLIKGSEKKKEHFSWRQRKKDSGGGILLDQGIHMVDMLNLFCGNFKEAKSYISSNFWKKDVEDNVYALLKNKNNVYASIHSSATLWKHKFSLDITLEKGMLNLSGILSGTKSYGKEKINIIRKKKNGKLSETEHSFLKDKSWQREIEYFVKQIRLNNTTKYKGNFSDAYKTMKVIHMIYSAN